MSNITQLDIENLEQYVPMGKDPRKNTTVGGRISSGSESFSSDLLTLSKSAFNSDDECTVHAVVDELAKQMTMFNQLINATNVMMDSLIDDITIKIIERENEFANTLGGKLD